MTGLIAILIFGVWILIAVVATVFLIFSSCFKMFQRRQTHFLPLALLLVLAVVVTDYTILLTKGQYTLSFLMTPLSLKVSVLCLSVGLIFGAWKFIRSKQKARAVFWVTFFIPPLLYSSSLVISILAVDIAVEQGAFTSSKVFNFDNLTSLIVEGNSSGYVFKHYNRKSADMFHVPYEVLELQVDGHHYVVSDKECSNNELAVNGKKYVLKEALRLTRGGAVVPDDSVRNPARHISLIPVNDPRYSNLEKAYR